MTLGTRGLLTLTVLAAVLLPACAHATPPRLSNIDRSQFINRSMAAEDILRIWVLYIGQGDAILVQFPRAAAEPGVEMLVDGGKSGPKLQQHMRTLYPLATPSAPTAIEHVVLTHHDTDHMQGLSGLFNDPRFTFAALHHNGLATWVRPTGLPAAARVVRDGDRFMGRLQDTGSAFTEEFRVDGLDTFRAGIDNDQFQGVYKTYAARLADNVSSASRATRGESLDLSGAGADVSVNVLWPEDTLHAYDGRSWSHTINGNSVVLNLQYNNFSMLFTGDMNSHSEESFRHVLTSSGMAGSVEVDVLKIPHHGSADNEEAFIRMTNPVISIASMGNQGFTRWGHPDEDVVSWAGGFRRTFHTHAHERQNYAGRTNAMVEGSHIVVETDGEWFRVFELRDLDDALPTVTQTAGGDGTRWIRAE